VSYRSTARILSSVRALSLGREAREKPARGKHSSGPAWWARWKVITAGIVVLVLGGTGAAIAVVASQPSAAEIAAAKARAAAQKQAAEIAAHNAAVARLAEALVFSPADGATSVQPDAPVTVSSSAGALASVTVTAGGSSVAGTLTLDHTKWTSAAGLQPGTTYSVVATVQGPGGATGQRTTSFSTLTPVAKVTLTLFPYGGMTVGVGEPVIVHFNHAVPASSQQSVLSHFTITESNPVPGGWHWFSPYELHFRPQNYWPTGEQVNVASDLDGWNAGDGRWGTGRVTANFVIGDAHVSVANLSSDRMTVYSNGAVVASYPVSGGRDQYPTMGGIHIVMDKEPVVHMVSSTVGIPVNSPAGYDEFVYQDVHISDSGEYVHDAPWSVGSQGRTNVSHGCINLGPNDSKAFYDFSRVGDVVQVLGSPRPPVAGDHGVMDWTTDWSQWTPGTVISSNPAPATTTTTTPSTPTTAQASAGASYSATTQPRPTTTAAPAGY
jgi:lipoprotein-anchoring transpeptidase ErfK/SrfK